MAQQYIASPGVQINEVDISLRSNSPLGVGVLAMGFTNQGPTDEVLQITTLEEYEAVYGKPTTAAERYSYHSVKSLFNSPASVFFSRLPYGDDAGGIFTEEKYSALVYPAIPDDETGGTSYATIQSTGVTAVGAKKVYLKKPIHVELTREEFEKLENEEITWEDLFGFETGADYGDIDVDMGKAGLIVLNKAKTTINEKFEGHYLALSDNRNTDPDSPFTDVTTINSVNTDSDPLDYITVPESRLNFELSADTSNEDSVSELMENIPSFNIGTNAFDDILTVGVFKLRQTPFTNSEIALSYALTESYVGSFDNGRELQSPTGGQNDSIFLETVDNPSNTLRFFVNPYLQDVFTLSLSGDSEPEVALRILDELSVAESPLLSAEILEDEYTNEMFALGVYQKSTGSNKTIGNVPGKIERVLDLVENPDLFELDLIIEGGLGTVYTSVKGCIEDDVTYDGTYDDRKTWTSLAGLGQKNADPLEVDGTFINYNSIYNAFTVFAEKRRKDCLFIADPIRQILVTGDNSRVLKQTYRDGDDNIVAKTFSGDIYWYLRNQFRIANSSYACTYANWALVNDSFSNRNVWVPFSGIAASSMANMDYVWEAPGGLTRGVLTGINDIAIYPKIKERDQLYKISINPVAFFPSDGFVIWGQKTLLAKPSAFDRINVRRVFLYLEKSTLNTAKYFVFEPNTLFTRTQVINVLTPLFESVKNKDGINDYRIVCSERNNTAEVLEQNQMKIDIYIKPTKTAEFIIVDFIATRQDANFEELI